MLSSLFSPLGIVLWVMAIVLVVRSPKKLRTLGWMAGAFLAVLCLFVLWGRILHMGDPEASEKVGGLVGLLVGVVSGLLHLRLSKPASTN